MWLDADVTSTAWKPSRFCRTPRLCRGKAEVIANSMTGSFEYERGDVRPSPDFNVFSGTSRHIPIIPMRIWYLTQMRRWGQIPVGRSDAWYDEVAKRVYRADLYLEAARALVDEGLADAADFPWETDGYREPQTISSMASSSMAEIQRLS
jgi:nitrate/nitrite transport system substrate-binding protein